MINYQLIYKIQKFEISTEDKFLLLFNSPLDTYDHLITRLLYENDEIKFDDVSHALTGNDQYRMNDKYASRDIVSKALTQGPV